VLMLFLRRRIAANCVTPKNYLRLIVLPLGEMSVRVLGAISMPANSQRGLHYLERGDGMTFANF